MLFFQPWTIDTNVLDIALQLLGLNVYDSNLRCNAINQAMSLVDKQTSVIIAVVNAVVMLCILGFRP